MDLSRELEMMERLGRLEKKVEFLLSELGLAEKEKAAPAVLDLSEVERLLRSGNRLEAVRSYRERTGSSLADAAKAVEELESRLKG